MSKNVFIIYLGAAPVDSTKNLNPFMLSKKYSEDGFMYTIGYNFYKNSVPASVLISAGGGFIITIIIILLLWLFYSLMSTTDTTRISTKLFDIFFAGFIV